MIPANDTSGTAHPVYEGGDLTDPGMSLRDRIAIEVMSADISARGDVRNLFAKDAKERARAYYRMADAMLEVRGGA